MDFGLCLYSTLLPSARDHGVFSLVNKEAVLEVRGDLRLDVMSQTWTLLGIFSQFRSF